MTLRIRKSSSLGMLYGLPLLLTRSMCELSLEPTGGTSIRRVGAARSTEPERWSWLHSNHGDTLTRSQWKTMRSPHHTALTALGTCAGGVHVWWTLQSRIIRFTVLTAHSRALALWILLIILNWFYQRKRTCKAANEESRTRNETIYTSWLRYGVRRSDDIGGVRAHSTQWTNYTRRRHASRPPRDGPSSARVERSPGATARCDCTWRAFVVVAPSSCAPTQHRPAHQTGTS